MPVSKGRGWGGTELTLGGAKGCPDAERRAGRARGTGHRAGEGARPGPVLAECVSGLLGRGAVSSSPVLLSLQRNATLSSGPGLPRTEITSKRLLSRPEQMEALVFLQETLVSAWFFQN